MALMDRMMNTPEGGGCPKSVGRGIIQWPCRVSGANHDGPCAAPEDGASMRLRTQWEREQEQAEAKTDSAGRFPVEQWSEMSDGVRQSIIDLMVAHGYTVLPPEGTATHPDGSTTTVDEFGDHLHAPAPGDAATSFEDYHNSWGPAAAKAQKDQAKVPTKQRPGDQRLPSGGGSCVQDEIIAMMAESKRVGIERYGQVLRTFNGRRTMVDVYDEARDLLVYLTQVMMEGRAERQTLVSVVLDSMRDSDHMKHTWQQSAEQIVERLEGWITANRLLPEGEDR